VLLNLLDNAIKYGPDGQTIAVTMSGDAPLPDGRRALVFTVDDEGPGIRAADRRRLWRPFVRLPNASPTDAPAGGTGLGLSVVKQLVEAHGGTVRLDDAPGGGTRVVVSLPHVGA
jgi:signal transduction histidine kinase